MRARFINEANFERNSDPLRSMGLGTEAFINSLKQEYKDDAYSWTERNITSRDLLQFCIGKNRWDDVERLASLPKKFFSKGAFKGSIAILMDYPNKMSQEEIIEKIDFLIDQGARSDIHQWGPFKNACSRGLPLIVEHFINLGADPNDHTDIPIRKTVEGLEHDHSYSTKNRQGYWDTIRVLVKHSKY